MTNLSQRSNSEQPQRGMTLQNALIMLQLYVRGNCRNGQFSEAQLMEARGVMNEAVGKGWLAKNKLTKADVYDYMDGKKNEVGSKAREWDEFWQYEALCEGPAGRRPG